MQLHEADRKFINRLIRNDQGDSLVVMTPDGVEHPTGFTSEAYSEPGDVEQAARHILKRWQGQQEAK